MLAEISPDTRFGASYHSQVSHRIDGIAAFNVPVPLAASPAFQNTPARTDLKTPEIVSLAASHDVSPEVTILAEAQWTNWSVVKNLRIERPDGSTLTDRPEQWHGTWFGSVGATYRLVSSWVIRWGVAYDATPIRNQFLTARLPDADRYWLALGFGYEWTPDLHIDAAYVHVFFASRSINETSQTGDLLLAATRATSTLYRSLQRCASKRPKHRRSDPPRKSLNRGSSVLRHRQGIEAVLEGV